MATSLMVLFKSAIKHIQALGYLLFAVLLLDSIIQGIIQVGGVIKDFICCLSAIFN